MMKGWVSEEWLQLRGVPIATICNYTLLYNLMWAGHLDFRAASTS